jgi:glycyl-tRNA synthetase beta chain
MLSEEGFSKDVISAVLSVSADNIPNVWSRTRALQLLKAEPDFEPLAVAFKRVVNIIKKAENFEGTVVEPVLFENDSESNLLFSLENVEKNVNKKLDEGAFDQALKDMATLRGPVDRFFDDVLVMAEDDRIRKNRLALLQRIATLFEKIADFSKIAA